MKKRKVFLILIGVVGIIGAFFFFQLADLRPENYKSPNEPKKAKELLQEMGVAHGIHVWDSIVTYNVVFKDDFYGFFGKVANPFDKSDAKLMLTYQANTSYGELQEVGNDEHTWVFKEGETYLKNGSGDLVLTKNKEMYFWIPTYQYFLEFPKRIQQATVIDYVGSRQIKGRSVEGIIASWDTTDPQRDIDQYLIWIDSATKRIVKVEYTVREMYAFVSGGAYFEDYIDYNGLLLPANMPVESSLVKNGLLHQMGIQEFEIVKEKED